MKRSEIIRFFPGVDPAALALLPVLDQFHEGIMILDANGVVLYLNEAQAKIDDLKADDAIGKTVIELYRMDEGASPTMTCLKTGRVIKNYACYYRTHLGRIVNSIHNIYPIRADGRVVGVICCITDYKNIEQTFTTLGKTPQACGVATFGVSPVYHRADPKKNGDGYTFDDIVGVNANLLSAVKSATLASGSPSPIMIYGETGTGKELFAQAIHSHSPRKDRPYVAINCAAIPDNLLEGMLFGTSRGAFTGAIDKAGIFETADGGTLFLDEINSMSPGLQVKLLRFLQERKVRRVGAMTEIDVDLKIISSVNTLPQMAIDAGLLRSDLFYRLAVVFIQIPPLRDRMGDLNRLITHFLVKINMNLDKRVTGIATDVLGQFEQYDWPGNVRELEHVIEGAMNMVGDKKTIEMHHLSVSLQVDNPVSLQADKIGVGAASYSPPSNARNTDRLNGGLSALPKRILVSNRTLAEEKADHEIALIQSALTATQGNAARAARKLGISPQSLNYKLKRFGIDRQAYQLA